MEVHGGPTRPSDAFRDFSDRLKVANAARGPDAQGSHRIHIQRTCQYDSSGAKVSSPGDACGLDVEFFAPELRLRGDAPIAQPHQQDGDVFCWNGEAFEGLNVDADENDGVKLFQNIRSLSTIDDLPSLLGKIEGPYAFVYHAKSRKMYFARDPLGRRSLLIHKPSISNPHFLLASVSTGNDQGCIMEELSTEAMFCLDIGRLCESNEVVQNFDSYLTCIPRYTDQQNLPFAKLSRVNTVLPPDAPPSVLSLDSTILPRDLSIAVDHLTKPKRKSEPSSENVANFSRVTPMQLAYTTFPPEGRYQPVRPVSLNTVPPKTGSKSPGFRKASSLASERYTGGSGILMLMGERPDEEAEFISFEPPAAVPAATENGQALPDGNANPTCWKLLIKDVYLLHLLIAEQAY